MRLSQCVPAALCSAFALLSASSYAELLIAPTRVVLEKNERSAELVLVNRSSEEAAYRISLENRRMLKDGSLTAATEAGDGELFADDIVRYAPRRLLMAPGGRQTVRVSATTAGLEPGEYRSHLRVMAAPTSAGRRLEAAASQVTADGISIDLIAIRSLTIPVIVRVGELGAEVSLEGAGFAQTQDAEPTLVARLTRKGNRSSYGDLHVYLDGSDEPVFAARGIAIYTPNEERDVILPIPAELRAQLSGKQVRLAYVSSDPDAPGVIAETVTVLN
jgi:hypothetical protein